MPEGISKECLERLRDAPDSIFEMPARHLIVHLLEQECKELDPGLPIDDAPKDRQILAYNPLTGWYKTKYIDGQWPCFGWSELTDVLKLDGADGCSLHFPQPTHYKELPPDPKE